VTKKCELRIDHVGAQKQMFQSRLAEPDFSIFCTKSSTFAAISEFEDVYNCIHIIAISPPPHNLLREEISTHYHLLSRVKRTRRNVGATVSKMDLQILSVSSNSTAIPSTNPTNHPIIKSFRGKRHSHTVEFKFE